MTQGKRAGCIFFGVRLVACKYLPENTALMINRSDIRISCALDSLIKNSETEEELKMILKKVQLIDMRPKGEHHGNDTCTSSLRFDCS